MTTTILPPFPIFSDRDGSPLDAGYIWIGVENLPPQTNPTTVYWDEALTQPAAQPIRTSGGYPVNNGTPAALYAPGAYSILAQDSRGTLVYSALSETLLVSSANVTFLQAGTGAVTRTAQSKMRDVVSVKDFGAVGDRVANDTAAIQNAINAAAAKPNGGAVYFPCGEYVVTSTITVPTGVSLLGEAIGVRATTSIQYGAVLYSKHASDVVVFNSTVPHWQSAENICILCIDAACTGGSGFVINGASVVLKNCKVWGAYLHAFVVGNGTAASYANELIGCYSNNPQTGSNYVINSTLFRGHNLLSDGGLYGATFSSAATNWSMGEFHFEGWNTAGMLIQNASGKTYGKSYLAGTSATGLIGALINGSANVIILNGLEVGFSALRANSIGVSIAESASAVTLRGGVIGNAAIGVSDSSVASVSCTLVDGMAFNSCTKGIFANATFSRYLNNVFVNSGTYDIEHNGGTGGLWQGNKMSLTGSSAIRATFSGTEGNFGGNAVKNNAGFVTRANGYIASQASGTAINHGLSYTGVPSNANLRLNVQFISGATGITSQVGFNAYTATQFTPNWSGTTPQQIVWEASMACDF